MKMGTGASGPADGPSAAPRRELLRALLRTHQRLIEARGHLQRSGAAEDPLIERDLSAITERVRILLSAPDVVEAERTAEARGRDDPGRRARAL